MISKIIYIITGTVSLISLLCMLKNLFAIQFANRAIGKVVDYKEFEHENSSLYRPIIEYSDHNNTARLISHPVSTDKKRYDIGTGFTILYFKFMPQRGSIMDNDLMFVWYLKIIGVCALVSAFVFVGSLRIYG